MQKPLLKGVGIFLIFVLPYQVNGQPSLTGAAAANDSNRYVCGFAAGTNNSDIITNAAAASNIDSAVIRAFLRLWDSACGGRRTIDVYKDAYANNPGYKYAAAKGVIDDQGNQVRQIFFKSGDISPLIGKLNNLIFYSIALHELGHHHNGDPFLNASRDSAELGADDYAGFILALRFHANLDSVLKAFRAVTDSLSINGYPARDKRLAAVRAGWNKGHGPLPLSLASAFVSAAIGRAGFFYNKVQLDFMDIDRAVKNTQYPVSANKVPRNLHKVTSSAEWAPGEFYLGSDYLYFKAGREYSVVGKVAKSNLAAYSTMVYDQFYRFMYIDSNNHLFTFEGAFPNETKDKPVQVGYVDPAVTTPY